jgi:microcystin-dependent protein
VTNPTPLPTGNVFAGAQIWGNANNLTSLLPSTLGNVGGSQAHPNMQPFLTLSCCIALQGIFPSQT